jgi:hypothetical protein
VDLATFRSRFPEFRTAGDAFVTACLNEAASELNSDELGDSYDGAHGLLAAHKLAVSPFGTNARMVDERGTTAYEREFSNVCKRAIVAVDVV